MCKLSSIARIVTNMSFFLLPCFQLASAAVHEESVSSAARGPPTLPGQAKSGSADLVERPQPPEFTPACQDLNY